MASPPSPSAPATKEEANGGGRKQNEAKKCGVCGDRALGYNFNAITCESCKAFFRRNALKNKEFRCPFQGECQVDQITRRFCQKCRLRKCFEIGMKKEWIMTEEEKRKKKLKIKENRARKIGDMGQDGDDDGESSEHSSSNNNNNNINSNNNDDDEGNEGAISLPSSSSSSTAFIKPQAVVVGVIREGDSLPLKVARMEDETGAHYHSQLESVRDCQTEYSSSCTLDSCSRLSEGESGFLSPAPATPSAIEEDDEASNPCLAEVFAISIKKEVEYTDDQAAAVPPSHDHRRHHHHHHHHNYQYYHEPPPPPHPTPPPPHHTPLPHPSPHHTPPLAHHTPPLHHTPSPQPPLAHHTPPPQYHTTSEIQPKSSEDSAGFSVREAMEILHPEDKNSEQSSSVMDTLMNTAIQAEYSSPLLALNLSPPSELNEAERAKLEELTEANKGLLAPLCEDYNFKDMSNPSLINVINLTEIAIRRLIKMAKRISSFKTLCQEDQIALLKGGCTEMMILRSVCAYDPDKDSWKIQQDHSRTQDIKLKVLKAAPGNVYEEHKRFILAFEPEWRKDPHIIFLLCAITLFSPRRPHIIHADAILHEQCSYLYLTRRYLAARYNPCAGRAVYHQLLHRLAHLHRLSEEHVRLFLEVNPKQVEPLLIEIFDLKQR